MIRAVSISSHQPCISVFLKGSASISVGDLWLPLMFIVKKIVVKTKQKNKAKQLEDVSNSTEVLNKGPKGRYL